MIEALEKPCHGDYVALFAYQDDGAGVACAVIVEIYGHEVLELRRLKVDVAELVRVQKAQAISC